MVDTTWRKKGRSHYHHSSRCICPLRSFLFFGNCSFGTRVHRSIPAALVRCGGNLVQSAERYARAWSPISCFAHFLVCEEQQRSARRVTPQRNRNCLCRKMLTGDIAYMPLPRENHTNRLAYRPLLKPVSAVQQRCLRYLWLEGSALRSWIFRDVLESNAKGIRLLEYSPPGAHSTYALSCAFSRQDFVKVCIQRENDWRSTGSRSTNYHLSNSVRSHEVRNGNRLGNTIPTNSFATLWLSGCLLYDSTGLGGSHHHHECATERRSQWWLLDTMRVSLLDDHVDLDREDVFI